MNFSIGDVVLAATALAGLSAGTIAWGVHRRLNREARVGSAWDREQLMHVAVPGLAVMLILSLVVAGGAFLANGTFAGGRPGVLADPGPRAHPVAQLPVEAAEVQPAEPDTRELATQLTHLKQQLADRDDSLKSLAGELIVSEATSQQYVRRLGDYQRLINQVRAELDLSQQVAAHREDALKDLAARLEDVQQQLQVREGELAGRDGQLDELRRQLASRQNVNSRPGRTMAGTARLETRKKTPEPDTSGWRSVPLAASSAGFSAEFWPAPSQFDHADRAPSGASERPAGPQASFPPAARSLAAGLAPVAPGLPSVYVGQ